MNNSNIPVLGIDVSKEELVIFDSSSSQIVKVANSEAGLKKFLSSFVGDKSDYQIAIESTGDYSYLAMKFFLKHGFTVKLINPIVTGKAIKSTVRGKKTDKSDARVIAEMVLLGEGRVVSENELDLTQKSLIRTERKLISIRSDLKRIKNSLQMKTKNGINLSQAILEIDELIDQTDQKAKNIWKLAENKEPARQEKIIDSHVGCGTKLSKIISEEAGDIKRFPSSSQFKAYVGIDPKVIQSGKMDIKGKMTKRGNPTLRHSIYLASFVASRYDPDLKAYYEKKRSEGKSHTHAVCTVARKMCERIYSTVIHDRFYEPIRLTT